MAGWSRRSFLKLGAGSAGTLLLPACAGRFALTESASPRELKAATARVPLVGDAGPESAVWAYNGQVPGPELRLTRGDRLAVELVNDLEESTSIHWHGLRLPHAMDGVPHLTQDPVEPGERFEYAFDLQDAGTYFYHPHSNTPEQMGRGLSGALIVEEPDPLQVDRDVVWMLDDWRLDHRAVVEDDFMRRHDFTHAGRIGNTVTINGQVRETFEVRSGERIRLRLINAANARVFALAFHGHRPQVIALDGQPTPPHEPSDARVTLGPGQRADVILDAVGDPGARFEVHDLYYGDQAYRLVTLAYRAEEPLRSDPLDASLALPENDLPEPRIDDDAHRLRVRLTGGARGGPHGGMLDGEMHDLRGLVERGKAWAINGRVADGHDADPLLTLVSGETAVLRLENATAWEHPMHLHGHHFRVLSRDGRETRLQPWRDTVLVGPRETVEIAFRAGLPGDWLFHCHALEHHAAGLGSVIRVT